MNKIKAAILLITTSLVINFTMAQNIDEAKKFLYYEKFKSAQAAFEKLLAANPNDADAAYWLGQTLIAPSENKNIAGAKALYLKSLAANSNSALLTAGVGHIELLEGKDQDARNHFETAISLSQGKSIAVLNAVGLANANFDIKNGDATYAIEKLKQATTLKGFKDPETWCLLGDAYRKFTDGGNAIISYQNALTVNPKYARALYRIGKVYQTQGASQTDIYMKYFNDALAVDPSYSPVYNNLYNLYYNTDAPKAGEYLNKYLDIMGSDEPRACYFRASQFYAQAQYTESIAKAKDCISSSVGVPYPKLYGLMAYAYDRVNDSVNAKNSFEQFFKSSSPENIGSGDYEKYGKILLKFPNNENIAAGYFDKAVALDTTETGKVATIKNMASYFEGLKKYEDAANWYNKILSIKKMPSKIDIYNTANNFSKAGKYQTSIEGWNNYISKYPTDTYGYYMSAVTQGKIDSTGTLGLAVPSYQKVTEVGEAQWGTDSAKVKTHVLYAYKYLIQYSYNIKKDKKAAIDYCNKYLSKDPTDAQVIAYKKMFETSGALKPTPTPVTKPTATPTKTTSTTSKSVSVVTKKK